MAVYHNPAKMKRKCYSLFHQLKRYSKKGYPEDSPVYQMNHFVFCRNHLFQNIRLLQDALNGSEILFHFGIG